jgi:hypothetical protein
MIRARAGLALGGGERAVLALPGRVRRLRRLRGLRGSDGGKRKGERGPDTPRQSYSSITHDYSSSATNVPNIMPEVAACCALCVLMG